MPSLVVHSKDLSLLDDTVQFKVFVLAAGAALSNLHNISFVALLTLVMSHELLPDADVRRQPGVLGYSGDLNVDRFIHFI